MKTLTTQVLRLSNLAFAAVLVALSLAAAMPHASAAVAQDTSTAPADGTWTQQRFMFTDKAPPQYQWIATLLQKSGPPRNPYGGAGVPVTYQVFQIIPDTRTIVAIGNTIGCVLPGNGAQAAAAPSICSLYTITEYANGQVNAVVSHPGCYFQDQDINPSSKNGSYFKVSQSTGTIDVTMIINGVPLTNCNASTHP